MLLLTLFFAVFLLPQCIVSGGQQMQNITEDPNADGKD